MPAKNKTLFVDTNIFLRFLTADSKKQHEACKKLFSKTKSGKIKLFTSSLVIFELIWTLESYYEETKIQIIEKISLLLELSNLKVENKKLLLKSLLLWQDKNMEFNDVFNFVVARKNKIKDIYSYDQHFDKLEIKRLEP